ncbi:hypothetical protein OPIT5_00230 (plasmid) [Opitutaceae bacterium TAV5]|nr:hypothetical protein OPIT5_00230 [Opitutaceae bacterium TAV5]
MFQARYLFVSLVQGYADYSTLYAGHMDGIMKSMVVRAIRT